MDDIQLEIFIILLTKFKGNCKTGWRLRHLHRKIITNTNDMTDDVQTAAFPTESKGMEH